MSTKTSNFEYTKPGVDEFYDVTEYNQTLDQIDSDMQEMKKAVNVLKTHTADKVTHVTADDKKKWNTSINDETPTYTESSTLQDLASGEKLSVAFGKMKKAVSVLKTHINVKASTSAQGHVKLSDSSAVTDSTGLALPATEKNASIEGTLANQIANLGKTVDLVWANNGNNFDNTDSKEITQSYEISDQYDSFIIFSTSGTVTSLLNIVGVSSMIVTELNIDQPQYALFWARRKVSIVTANSKRYIQFDPCYYRAYGAGEQVILSNGCNAPFRIYGIRK